MRDYENALAESLKQTNPDGTPLSREQIRRSVAERAALASYQRDRRADVEGRAMPGIQNFLFGTPEAGDGVLAPSVRQADRLSLKDWARAPGTTLLGGMVDDTGGHVRSLSSAVAPDGYIDQQTLSIYHKALLGKLNGARSAGDAAGERATLEMLKKLGLKEN